ncbi:hypothetical protein FA15DRAFT_707842 [Coprinopsis marcescibilis]|uniref:Uncharacterized protein n=1 Tax=Coprinopsis marcescibilis TaxID=230819 RepID=A0A5C3KKM7_COPMA|nr:hypothetical protein FA15DRAFT_707842 [Coprinopsis marcescibilis]
MYSTLLAVALFVAPVFSAYAVNNPDLVQCQTARISWPHTTYQYNVIAVAADEPCGEPLVDIGDLTESFIDWQVNIPAGTVVQLSVADSGDAESWTRNLTVAASDDSSCLPGFIASSSAAAASRPTSAPARNLAGSSAAPRASPSAGSDDSAFDPIGAVNAADLPFSAAPSTRQLGVPALALGALAALAALAL